MQGWLKNGARMTVAVTAFAAAGAGIAYSQESRPAQQAGHTAIELTAVQLPAGGGPAQQFGLDTGIGGPLGCMSYIGKPAQTVQVPANASTNGMGVLGTDTSEEYSNPANIPGSNEDMSSGLGGADTSKDATDASADEGGLLGSAATNDENTGPANLPAGDQGDQMCTTASTTGGMPSGHHHHGSGSGAGRHHHGSGSGAGRHHHGSGSGAGRHHGSGAGAGRHHHGSGSGAGMRHHGTGKGSHPGRAGHHMTGGKAASTGAKEARTTASMPASSSAAETGTLPVTGAPLAALLGLAVAALAAGLVARRVGKRDTEAEPEEG